MSFPTLSAFVEASAQETEQRYNLIMNYKWWRVKIFTKCAVKHNFMCNLQGTAGCSAFESRNSESERWGIARKCTERVKTFSRIIKILPYRLVVSIKYTVFALRNRCFGNRRFGFVVERYFKQVLIEHARICKMLCKCTSVENRTRICPLGEGRSIHWTTKAASVLRCKGRAFWWI